MSAAPLLPCACPHDCDHPIAQPPAAIPLAPFRVVVSVADRDRHRQTGRPIAAANILSAVADTRASWDDDRRFAGLHVIDANGRRCAIRSGALVLEACAECGGSGWTQLYGSEREVRCDCGWPELGEDGEVPGFDSTDDEVRF